MRTQYMDGKDLSSRSLHIQVLLEKYAGTTDAPF